MSKHIISAPQELVKGLAEGSIGLWVDQDNRYMKYKVGDTLLFQYFADRWIDTTTETGYWDKRLEELAKYKVTGVEVKKLGAKILGKGDLEDCDAYYIIPDCWITNEDNWPKREDGNVTKFNNVHQALESFWNSTQDTPYNPDQHVFLYTIERIKG